MVQVMSKQTPQARGYVALMVTASAREAVNHACLRAGANVGQRVPQWALVAAAVKVAEGHADELDRQVRALLVTAERFDT